MRDMDEYLLVAVVTVAGGCGRTMLLSKLAGAPAPRRTPLVKTPHHRMKTAAVPHLAVAP